MDLHETIVSQFERSAASRPAATSVVCGPLRWTYDELNRRTNRLARYLRSKAEFVSSGLVACCFERSADYVAAALATWKAGGAVLPIDPRWPDARRNEVLDRAGVRVVITHGLVTAPAATGRVLVHLGHDFEQIQQCSDEALDSRPGPEDLAYGMLTSGSTATPRLVLVSHVSLSNYVSTLDSLTPIRDDDRCVATANFSFTASVRQLFVPLAKGAAVVIPTRAELLDPPEFLSLLARERVSVLDCVPTYLQRCITALRMLPEPRQTELTGNDLRVIRTSGEVLRWELVDACRRAFPEPEYFNLLGLTETTGVVLGHRVGAREDGRFVPLGRPLAGTKVHVLDEDRGPTPPGETGELWVTGPALARGYLGDDQGGFVVVELGGESTRAFRTGDAVRVRPDGVFEYVSRVDDQIKVRGMRVGLVEIDAAMAELPGVAEAAAVFRDVGGRDRLIGYYSPAPGAKADPASLRQTLLARLPEHMVPAQLVELSSLPRTESLKIDRTALRGLEVGDASTSAPAVSAGGTLTPRDADPIHRLVHTAWAEVLGLDSLSGDEDFFELGGDSIQAMEVAAKIQEHLPVELSLITAFFGDVTVDVMVETIIDELEPTELEQVRAHLAR